ncbi:MAG: DNA cytosine methyltransferase [Proteobacteria bacterium]|nr:DNA cytosine methyltransferase [Pseudomonadota bacterium]
MPRFVDLFAGIGGFHVALAKRGHECVFASEIDPKACEAYKANFGMMPAGDICDINARDIPNHDILCAGFPCQAFSIAGKRNLAADPRGRLFYEIIRIAKAKRPRILLLENVKNILSIDNGEVRKIIYSELDAIGYDTKHALLNAGDFGTPQKRERVYFVAIRKDESLRFTDPKPKIMPKLLRDITFASDHETDSLVINRPDTHIINPNALPAPKPVRVGHIAKGQQGNRIYSVNGHAVTLLANGGGHGGRTGLYYINERVRRLHISEAKQVMGFNRKHILSPGLEGYRQLGNAIVPEMVDVVIKNVRSAA